MKDSNTRTTGNVGGNHDMVKKQGLKKLDLVQNA